MDAFFLKIYSEYKQPVYYFVKKYISSQDDIEDVVQDIFVHLWNHRSSLEKNREAVIFKTAKQEVSNFYRKNKVAFSDLKEEHHLHIVKEEVDEEDFAFYGDKINQLLHLLPERSKSFFILHKVEGLSYSQIASENSISKNAVAKHVNKVLDFLRTGFNLF